MKSKIKVGQKVILTSPDSNRNGELFNVIDIDKHGVIIDDGQNKPSSTMGVGMKHLVPVPHIVTTVHSLYYDTDTHTGVKAFSTEQELDAELVLIMEKDIRANKKDKDLRAIQKYIKKGDIDYAWELYRECFPNDHYIINEHTLTVKPS